jgi:hypothetical protein
MQNIIPPLTFFNPENGQGATYKIRSYSRDNEEASTES